MTDTADKGARPHDAALIVGAGLSGMQTALLLAETGRKAILVDSAPGIGGSLHLLDRTFPTDSCGLCIGSPVNPTYCPSLECGLHPNIRVIPYSEVVGIQGDAGDFSVEIVRKPRYVDLDKCDRCGECVAVCPASRPDTLEGELNAVKAIYAPPMRSVPDTYVIDDAVCTWCGECARVCPRGAIDLKMQETRETLRVGAVVLSPGFQPFDARKKGEYGFGHLSNVITSLQFERMTSAPGSTRGMLVRPSDGQAPKRIAFIHCVGSRDQTVGREYCSSVCCMHTAKQARAAVEIQPGVDVTVFHMDLRAFGKDYDEYLDAVRSLPGVTYRRAMVSAARQHPRTGELTLTTVDEDGRPIEHRADLLVLSVGFEAPETAVRLANEVGVSLSPYGFAQSADVSPVAGSRPGVIVAGCFREPKDIPDTMPDAAAAAAEAARYLRPPEAVPAALPSAAPASADAEPRIGVLLCTCNGDISRTIDTARLGEYAQSIGAASVLQTADACGNAGLGAMQSWIRDQGLTRVVLGGCSYRAQAAALEGAVRQAGLEPSLLTRVNLREQCAWVHRADIVGAANKARDLIAMAVARARYVGPAGTGMSARGRRALVIGGGIAGMTVALTLADLGHPVTLVEKREGLGGWAAESHGGTSEPTMRAAVAELARKIEDDDAVTVLTEGEVIRTEGTAGQYVSTVRATDSDATSRIEHATLIVATGGGQAGTGEYLFDRDPRVVLQSRLTRALAGGASGLAEMGWDGARSVVMIQCVGSREPKRPYCSRTCCTEAVTNAVRLKELLPDVSVSVLFRDIRTFGQRELVYLRARELGVRFFRFNPPQYPTVSLHRGALEVSLTEPVSAAEVTLQPDLLVLSTGVMPQDNVALSGALGTRLDAHGFFEEQHPKLRPMDLSKPGMYACGLAHGPCSADEAVAQAQGAAMRAAAFMARAEVESKPTTVRVNKRLCSFCGLCVTACPYGARVMDDENRVAQVVESLCQGCGVCAMVCPNKATQQQTLEHRATLAEIDAAVIGL